MLVNSSKSLTPLTFKNMFYGLNSKGRRVYLFDLFTDADLFTQLFEGFIISSMDGKFIVII